MKVFILGVFLCLGGVWAGDFCNIDDDDTDLQWCDWGCCTDDVGRTSCCEDTGVGMIVGIVLGCLGLVAMIVSIVVAVCCCMRRNAFRRGVVYRQNPTTTITTAGISQGYGEQPIVYGSAVAYPATVETSGMAQGTITTWQSPPPPYTAQKS